MRVGDLRKALEKYDDNLKIVIIDSTTQRGYSSFHITPDKEYIDPDDEYNEETIIHKLIIYV